MENKKCPACHQTSKALVDWQFSGLNDSIFNYTANFYCCERCGLVYVDNVSDSFLARFYQQECSYYEKAHFDINSPANIAKYSAYRNVLLDEGLQDCSIMDIGCGRGGFLLWLTENGWQAECYGIDVDIKSMPADSTNSQEGYTVKFRQGDTFAIPGEDASQQLLSYFHVFEHIRDIDAVLDEAYRVLQTGGTLLIEVPDAENYVKQPIGSAFWLGIREHIYHFSAQSLIASLQRHGFAVSSIRREMLPTPEFEYPSLMLVAKKEQSTTQMDYSKTADIASFVTSSQQALFKQAKQIRTLQKQYGALTFWGCSSELFSLLPLLADLEFNLCDASKLKQQSLYQGQTIFDPGQVKIEGLLVVAPYLCADVIEQAAINLGWNKNSIIKL